MPSGVYPRTAEHRANLCTAQLRRWANPAEHKKMSKVHIGYRHSAKTKIKMSESHSGLIMSPATKAKIGRANRGRELSSQTKAKISESQLKRFENPDVRKKYIGVNSPKWKGGITYKRKPPELNFAYIQSIRRRDNFTCQLCGDTNKGKHRRLETHHIDYNRQNSHPDNLITSCKSCHWATRYVKKVWIRICRNLIKRIKKLNPKGHQAALELYERNMKLFYHSA